MITIYCYSDDLVEVEGCEGADEFSADRWTADLVAPGGTEQMRVHCWYDDDGCWQVGVGQTIEDVQMPPWPITVTQQTRRDGEPGYSALLSIDAPEGTRLTNVKPEPQS